ncbi:MAG: hypothetical protein ACRC1W_09410, partial [Shewanella sp.]
MSNKQCENAGPIVARQRPAGIYSSAPFCVDVDCITTTVFPIETVDASGTSASSFVLADPVTGLITTTPFTGNADLKVPCTVGRVKIVDSCGPEGSIPPVPLPPVVAIVDTCTGTKSVDTKPEPTTRVVQEPGTAFNVKLCDPPAALKIEF